MHSLGSCQRTVKIIFKQNGRIMTYLYSIEKEYIFWDYNFNNET